MSRKSMHGKGNKMKKFLQASNLQELYILVTPVRF